MLGLDFQMSLMRAWSDTAIACMNACTSAYAGAMEQAAGVPRAAPRTRSWYRAPDENPFALSPFGIPTAFPFAMDPAWFAPAALAAPFWGAPMLASNPMLQPWQAWSSLIRSPFFAPLPNLSGWPVAASKQPANWWSAMTEVAPQPVAHQHAPVFAAYRSDSGHAVTQITFPNQVVAAVAMPAQQAYDPLSQWSLASR